MMEFTFDGIVRQGFGFYNPNHAAALICALLPFCWAGLLRWKHPAARAGFAAATLTLTIALALTFSRSGLLIFFVELLLFGLLTGRRSWKVVPWIATGGVLLFLAAGVWGRFVLDRAVTNRFDIWLAGASLFAANPWLGVGHGNSGTLATAFLLRDGIVCRTLVNSHLTLFAEYGIFPGLLWAGGIVYALIAGWRRQRRAAWVSFAGMCTAAGFATVFDWGVLFDFREWGGLPLTNFLLSWLLFLLFLGNGVWLCAGGFRWRNLAVAAGIAGVCGLGLLCFPAGGAPRVRGGVLFPPSAGEGRTLVLLPAGMALKDAAAFLARQGCEDWRIPLLSRLPEQPAGGEVILFGSAAEYAAQYANGRLLFVSPPGYFTLPERTEKLFLPRFRREFSLEAQAEERKIPIVRY
ncbi:O-antigen ligase [uncultured Victivallis sp.]|uniref:O-antigen ligase family protein n=1 Tax=uncultured Victivallis sp. TaxID=354118 RepID=UPI0025CFA22C|nr:O-antigen ligase family protein [uncultured Victivallis sp.]